MKRITSIIVVMILCLSLLSMNVFAASATVSATGSQTAETGDAIQVKLNLTATDVYGISGVINFDASQLRLESAAAGYGTLGLMVHTNNKFTVIDNGGETLANGTIVVLNFTVLEATAGTTVSVSFGNLVATDGRNDLNVASATYSFTVAEPETTEPEATEPETTEPETTEPETTEPKPTEPKPTEPKPTEPKPTEPQATEPTATEPSSEPSTEATEPSEQGTEPTEQGTEPTEPGAADGDGEKKCCWWCWILILIAVALLTWHLIVVFKKKRKEQETP